MRRGKGVRIVQPNEERDFPERQLYEEAIRQHVCTRCIDFGKDGICHSLDPQGCSIFRFLPELVTVAASLHELKIEPYLQAVRKNVCMKCWDAKFGGKCGLRDTLDCGLDRYLPLVIEAIEEVQEMQKKSREGNGS